MIYRNTHVKVKEILMIYVQHIYPSLEGKQAISAFLFAFYFLFHKHSYFRDNLPIVSLTTINMTSHLFR